MRSSSFNERSYRALLKTYRKLAAGEQRILQVLAVVCQPINQTELQSVLHALATVASKDAAWQGLEDSVGKPWRERMVNGQLLQQRQNRLVCHPLLLQTLSREAVAQGIYARVAAEVLARWPVPGRRGASFHYSVDPVMGQRRLQHAFYLQRYDELFKLLGVERRFAVVDEAVSAPLVELLSSPWDEQTIIGLPGDIIFQVLAPRLFHAPADLGDVNERFALLARLVEQGVLEATGGTAIVLVQQLLYRGRLDEAQALLVKASGPTASALFSWLRCVQGDYPAAIERYQDGLKQLRKVSGKRNDFLPGMPAVCYTLSLLQSRDRPQLLLAQKFVQLVEKSRHSDEMFWIVRLLGDVASILQGQLRFEDSDLLCSRTFAVMPPYLELFRLLAHVWLEAKPEHGFKTLVTYTGTAQQAGWYWYAREGAAVLEALGQPLNSTLLKQASAHSGGANLVTLIKPIPAWQRSLLALREIVEVPAGSGPQGAASPSRLVWLLDVESGRDVLAPCEQRILKSGRWSKGRAVALRRLVDDAEGLDFLTVQDRRVCRHIRRQERWSHYSGQYELALGDALRALVGHPLVFWARNSGSAVEIVAAEPELQVQQKGQQLLIQLYPFPAEATALDGNDRSFVLIKDSEHCVRLVQYSPQHSRIAEILGEGGLTVPAEAKAQVLASIDTIAPLLTVHSDIGGGRSGAREVDADARLHLHLQPAGEGLRLEWYVRPFARAAAQLASLPDSAAQLSAPAAGSADERGVDSDGTGPAGQPELGPMFRPGEGGTTVFAEIGGEKLQTKRALEGERSAVEQLLTACQVPASVSDGEYVVDDAEAALDLLLALQDSEQGAVLAWPRGQKIRLSRETGTSKMQLSVRRERDWFALDGQLQLDEDRVLELGQLMTLLQASPGRFVHLGGGEVLALTEDLRRRLRALSAYSQSGQFHPLATEALDDALQGMAVDAGEHWRRQLGRLAEVRQLEPKVPSTLQAELRDYQREGYAWLARLAHWGAGACLADDMGLGKTVQALALILSRASQGPTLVLAPTSVCMNWLDEARRFAPTLRVQRFGEHSDRQTQLDQLQAFDVLVCSYGLLQREGERLADIAWHTIVADEAQAIKNPVTQRSRAVMALQGDFKMITTGTPVENHLGELWNLFRFINPGLLGSLKEFNQRFAVPIEVQNSREVKQQLKQLIRPFILRRMKSDVLTELPARTEVTLHVELDAQEQAFYEALRREAIKRLAETDEEANPGKQRVKMLAEIMRLRRACCNPRLVMPDSTVGSAKLKAFGSVLQELLESRHKALVFSQFVGHLDILRDYLEQKGISYQYLDGSTPAQQRQRAVEAFQSGDGDVFLISLKAGGAGLNLTAADYVIHMDPWWNPAVEDQASDRAHRMGQQRPVTIYRLVAKNTIEEKIVGMHEQKRDLANSLLEGSDMSGRMSVDEMMALLREA